MTIQPPSEKPSAAKQPSPKKPGRPKGSKTKTLTPAMKIARAYVDLLCSGLPPTSALHRVAGEWQVTEETVRRYSYRHNDRLIEEYEREFTEYAETLVEVEKVKAAMLTARELINRMLAGWRATLPAELAALESQDAIHARLAEVVHEGLAWLAEQCHAEARALSNEPACGIDPAIPHGGVIYFEGFAEAVKPRKR